MAGRTHVGTLGEKPLHAALKRWYAQPGDRIEEPLNGFVIDLVRDGLLIEIQTRGFASMKRKLTTLLVDGHAVRLVHPIPVAKWIVKVGDGGELVSRRRSPKRGVAADLFSELVSFPDLVGHPGLTVEVLTIHEEEVRFHDPTRAWRRRGWVVEERRLLEVLDRRVIDSPAALMSLLPDHLPPAFTTADLAEAMGRPRRLAQQATYCLRHAGVIEQLGKERNAIVYGRCDDTVHDPA